MISSIPSFRANAFAAPRFDTTTDAGADAVTGADEVQGPVEPSQPRTALPVGPGGDMGRDQFLQLLVAQLRNQDPLNPMDAQDMAAQLAQFSQVEQLLQINEAIQAQQGAIEGTQAAIDQLTEITIGQGDALAALLEQSMAISTVGRTGVVEGDDLFIDRDGNGTVTFDAGSVEGTAGLVIYDEDGARVRDIPIGAVSGGMQSIDLQDLDLAGDPLPPGRYRFTVNVTDDRGATRPAQSFTTARITGLRYERGEPVLLLADQLSVPFTSLLQIRD
jgi:flagellar basal-body rod modification protein FlgD